MSRRTGRGLFPWAGVHAGRHLILGVFSGPATTVSIATALLLLFALAYVLSPLFR